MTHPLCSRAARSKLHLAVLDAVGDDDTSQAFAEAVAWADTGDIADLGTLFSLADAIAFQVAQHVYRSDCQYTEAMADNLREVHGTATVNLALKLAGYFARQRGLKTIWTDVPNDNHTHAIPIVLPANLLEDWNKI